MSYTFKQNLVSSSKYSVKCPYALTPQYITVHDTANSAPAKNEISYMISNSNQTSFHIAVDETEAIQGLPLNRNAWACGDGASGSGNRKSISVEICRPTNTNRTLYDQAEENAVYVVARLLYKFGLGIDKLRKHQDWSGKKCPNVILSENRWESFKDRVRWVLEEIKKGNIDSELESGTTGVKVNKPSTPTVDSTPTISIQIGDTVKVNTTATKYATVDKAIPDYVKGSAYTVSKVDSDKVLLKEITSWVYVKDVTKVGGTTSNPAQPQTQETFKVKIICDSLNIRKVDSFDSAVVGTVSKGEVYTIVEVSNGLGLLKSGVGWISMGSAYAQKI